MDIIKKVEAVSYDIFYRLLVSLFVLCGVSQYAVTATISITDDIQTYSSLSDTIVNMNGVAELHLTAASSPLNGCTVNLDSLDSWLFLEQIKPSLAASSSYLSQIRVNGTTASTSSNIRVVQYASGAVLIPHSPDFQPMEVFENENFFGRSMHLSQYTAYNSGSLGAIGSSISSFILKRGYTATLAQNADGTGFSKNYVAQDCDIEVGVLPQELDNQVNFIRIFPWRWVSKKGACDDSPYDVEPHWFYNWNINSNSTLDWEYVAIRQQPYWPGLDQDWKARGVSHLSGFNEPDNSAEDAYKNLNNGSVSSAIDHWPPLLNTGLRVGAPAVTDGGSNWLYEFMDSADAAGLRVDYVPIHYYKCYGNNDYPTGAADALYNFLKSVHDRVQRPLWVTEFNNGANWTEDYCADPDINQNKNVIEAMINMMDSVPWIERYAIYSNVEWTRRTHYDDGSLTPMGIMYRDHESPIGYQQKFPDSSKGANAVYDFDNNFRDISDNGNHPLVYGAPKKAVGKNGNAFELDGRDDYLVLPTTISNSADFTFVSWVYWNGGNQWQRIFDFGADTSNYMFVTPSAYSSQLRFAITNSGYNGEQRLESGAFPVGQWTHLAITLNGNVGRMYLNGTQVDVKTINLNPANINAINNFIGKSQFAADPLFNGMLDDVFFADYALTASEISAIYSNKFPEFNADIIDGGSAVPGVLYSGDISSYATDPDNDILTFSKSSGPDWLEVSTDGRIYGTPGYTNSGHNTFVIQVADGANGIAYAQLTIDIEHIQAMTARYTFDNDISEEVAGIDGTAFGTPSYTSGRVVNAVDLDGSSDYITLPAGIVDTDDCTIAAWVYWDGGGNWQRIFDFGNNTSSYMFLTPSSSASTLRFAFKNGGAEQFVETSRLASGQWVHVAITVGGDTGRLYVNGSLRASNTSMTINPSYFNPVNNLIGDSQWSADPLFNGKIDDLRIYNYALSIAGIRSLAFSPAFTSDLITNSNGVELASYSGNSLADYAQYSIDFSMVAGPDWLNVSPDGTLSGIPSNADVGTNVFTVRVDNGSGLFDTAELQIDIGNIYSGTQGIEDLSGLVANWLEYGCVDNPACNGSSLDGNDQVDMGDFSIMSQSWLTDESLQLYLSFESVANNTFEDKSIYQRTAYLVNGPESGAGYIDNGLVFDGVDDYVYVKDYRGISGANPRTISAWIKAEPDLSNEDETLRTIVSWGKVDRNDKNKKVMFLLDDSTGQLALAIYGARLLGGADLEDGLWHHVALVLPSGANNINQVKLYVDGSEIATNAENLDAVINTALTEDVIIGAFDDNKAPGIQSGIRNFNGSIDEVRVYNRDLSATEIEALASTVTE